MTVFVAAKDGTPLMPTFNIKKVRRMLKDGRAKIYGYSPFTIQLQYESTTHTQEIEACEDTGDHYVGFSLKSKKHEYVSGQYDHLTDEKLRHDDARKLRRSRRNHKRYRKPRFDNRRHLMPEGDKWFAPSIRNKINNHLSILQKYHKACPIKDIYLECGSFDTQTLQAVEAGLPAPKGKDFQRGSRYGYDTLREAVFARDGYRCICCGKGIEDGAVLRLHHLGYKTGDHTNRMSGLATVCTKCHTPAAHKPGGKLYELEPKLKPFKAASFMTSMRFQLIKDAKVLLPNTEVHICYGAYTKRERLSRRISKSHANDAYCIGCFRSAHRTDIKHYKKLRRNNRILEKFYDAKVIDVRDGTAHKGAELSCNRTNRSISRNNENNLRIYRGIKVSKGHRNIRTKRYAIRPGDMVLYQGKRYKSKGLQHYGEYTTLEGHKAVKVKDVKIIKHTGGWETAA